MSASCLMSTAKLSWGVLAECLSERVLENLGTGDHLSDRHSLPIGPPASRLDVWRFGLQCLPSDVWFIWAMRFAGVVSKTFNGLPLGILCSSFAKE